MDKSKKRCFLFDFFVSFCVCTCVLVLYVFSFVITILSAETPISLLTTMPGAGALLYLVCNSVTTRPMGIILPSYVLS